MSGRLVVLVSGGGTNLQALIDASRSGHLDGRIVGVVSNRADAFGLVRAERAAIPTSVVAREDGEPRGEAEARSAYDQRLADAVEAMAPDLVVLAGFMRILTPTFLDRFEVVNLHPALPGTFPGTNAIERAFEAWQQGAITESGAMVHWVPDAGVDVGPVIATTVVPFVGGDTLGSFESRMHQAEHRLLVEVVQQVLSERPTHLPSGATK